MENNIFPKILFISSANPLVGPGRIMLDYYKAFSQCGINADFLTLNPVEGYPTIKSIFDKNEKPTFWFRLRRKILKQTIYRACFWKPSQSHYFFYKWEELPPIPNSLLLSKIQKDYDFVMILFWQNMLSFSSLKAIYKRLCCPIQILAPDFSHMSGGCHFTCECQEYKTGCKHCHGVRPYWLNNFSAHNVRYRKKVFDLVKPIVGGNEFMQMFYDKSVLLKDVRRARLGMIIDLSVFRPQNNMEARNRYMTDHHKSFIISFGCQSLDDPRKGINYLFESLKLVDAQLSEEEKKSILVISMGHSSENIKNNIPFDTFSCGFLPLEQLPEVYSISDVFLCPSVYDAGPMMVNQALCCGTPVVAFDIGTAIQCVKNQNTGYCVPLKDTEAFAKAIIKIFRQTGEDKKIMRDNALQYAQNHYSYKTVVNEVCRIYNKYKDA